MWNLLAPLVSSVTGYLGKREERKIVKVKAEAKINQLKISSDTEVTLTDQEWETISKKNENETWKDEYITIVITLPLIGQFIGAIWFAFSETIVDGVVVGGDDRLLKGLAMGNESLAQMGIDMGELMYIVVLAAVGLKVWRGR